MSEQDHTVETTPSAAPISPVWHDGAKIPPVEQGQCWEFIVAVYRKRTGKVYSFAASYLNAYPLHYDHECPQGKTDRMCEGCEDGCPTTGWFDQTGHDDYASTFSTLNLRDGDTLKAWSEIPKWSDAHAEAQLSTVREQALEEAAKGWAIVDAGVIGIKTVSDTRRAAIVNWLVVEKNYAMLDGCRDDLIENAWDALRGDADAVQVRVACALSSPSKEEGEGHG